MSVLTQTLALSLAEICSKYPTSAGAYYWCYRLASPRTRILTSWINGWLTVVGVWTIALSVTFGTCPIHNTSEHHSRHFTGTAQLVVAGAGIYHPEWIATPWQTCKTSIPCSKVFFLPLYDSSRCGFPRHHCCCLHILPILQQVLTGYRRKYSPMTMIVSK